MDFDYSKVPGREWKKKPSADIELALVSIITPFYNAGKYFEQTFNSVMNQTFPWFEWVIVDDGSTEEEDIKILHEISGRDGRIRVVRQENGGLACARNTAIANAKTEIVIPLDADDVISPQYVECTYFALYFNREASWCYTDTVGFSAQEYLWKKPWDAEKLKTENFLLATSAIRKKDIDEIGGYKVEKWSYFEDWRFWLEMLGAHKKPVSVNGYFFWYRRLDKGMLSNIVKDPERTAFCENVIKTAAASADTTVEAIEYPISKSLYPYHKPEILDFGEKYRVNPKHGKNRILMLIPGMEMGGADKFNLDLAAGIDKNKFEISLISTVESKNEWHQKFEEYTDEIFHLPDFLDAAHFGEFISYYIATREIDILMVTNSYRGYYLVPWLRKNFPALCIIDYIHMEEWYWKAGGYARPSGMLGAFFDKTYVCNSATRDVMIKEFGRNAESVETVYIGVDEDEFQREKVPEGQLYARLNVTRDRQFILFPCRIHPQKRPFMMLEIASHVVKKNPKALFVVIGDGEQLPLLQETIKKLRLQDFVACIGYQDNMKECYRDASLTLICSIKEGLALTAYESCAMGVPVISSDVGGQKDLVDDSVGRLIPMRQSEAFDLDKRVFDEEEVKEYADAILELLSDDVLYERCSKMCRKKIEETFSTKRMLHKMEDEFIRLLADEKLEGVHRAQAQSLLEFGALAEELYVLELAEEAQEMKSIEIWNAKEYLEMQLSIPPIKRSLKERMYQIAMKSQVGRLCWRILSKIYKTVFKRPQGEQYGKVS